MVSGHTHKKENIVSVQTHKKRIQYPAVRAITVWFAMCTCTHRVLELYIIFIFMYTHTHTHTNTYTHTHTQKHTHV